MDDLIKEVKEYTIKIFGINYIVRSSEDEEFVAKVATILDNKMLEISKKAGNIGQVKLAILTSLNIIEENLKIRIKENKILTENRELNEEIKHYQELYNEAKEQYLNFQSENELLKNQVRNLETDLENLEIKISEKEKVETDAKDKELDIENLSNKVNELETKLKENKEKYI